MSNRFKFRVWNKATQCFIPEKEIFICGNGELVLIDEALNRTWVKDNPNYVVSLCSGLHDKNNKLVYEGDVVIYKGNLKVVVFDEINLCHCLLWVKHYNPQWKSSTSGLKYDKVTKTKKLEVISNIYENADLLEGKEQ